MGELLYNHHYEETIIKYTLNIPIEQYGKISKVTHKRTKYGGRKSTFIREAIDEKLAREFGHQDRAPISRSELMRLERGEVYEPPKRFHGFIEGLLGNTSKWINWNNKRKKYLDSRRFV